jgi:hypothetical protein
MNDLITFTQAGSVIAACWAIVSGIGAWKREFIGKRKIELAEQVLAKFFEIKDAVAFIRNPFSQNEEGSTRKRGEYESQEATQLLDRAYIVWERYSKKESAFVEFNTLKYRFMAAFGTETQQIFIDTNAVLHSIFSSAQILGTYYWQRQGRVTMGPEEFEKHLKEMHEHERIFWDHQENTDTMRLKLQIIQEVLDRTVKPCFEEPMRTYDWLTRPMSKWFPRNSS